MLPPRASSSASVNGNASTIGLSSRYSLHLPGPLSYPSWKAPTRSNPLPCALGSILLVPGWSRTSSTPASALSSWAALTSKMRSSWACLDHAPAKQSACSSFVTVRPVK